MTKPNRRDYWPGASAAEAEKLQQMNRQHDVTVVSKWAPRPASQVATYRKDYHAGYSDGWYGYHFGAGHDNARECEAYRSGYADGREDMAS